MSDSHRNSTMMTACQPLQLPALRVEPAMGNVLKVTDGHECKDLSNMPQMLSQVNFTITQPLVKSQV